MLFSVGSVETVLFWVGTDENSVVAFVMAKLKTVVLLWVGSIELRFVCLGWRT